MASQASSTPSDPTPPPPLSPRQMQQKQRKRERWWWLALTIVVSLLLHVGIGWESRGWRLLGSTASTAPTPPPGEVEVDFGAEPNKPDSKPVQTANRAPAPRRAAPVHHETPVREAPRSRPNAHPAPAQPLPPRPAPTAATNNVGGRAGSREPIPATPAPKAPTLVIPPTRVTPSSPSPVVAVVPAPAPTARATPGLPTAPVAPPALPNKLGTPDKPEKKPETPPQRTPAPSPPPATGGAAPDKNGTTPAPVATPKVAVAAPTAPTGSGTHEPSGAPIAGGSARIGISRGIPFGSRTGLSGRLPPGEGIGPDGQPIGVKSGYDSSGTFHVRLQKPTAASLGLTPARIVYVLDVSGSMIEDNKIGLARQALRDAVNELLPDDKFTFVTFSDHATAYSKNLLAASPFSISTLESNVDLVQPNGATDLSDALDLAMNMTGVRNIFLISDGEPNVSISNPDALSAHLKQINSDTSVHITVFALGAGEQFPGVKLLRRIADENGGEYRYINDKTRFDK